MAKGLEKLLEQIRKRPSGKLISRYLALISDMEPENERVRETLDLAETLTAKKPLESMRIAHMAYQANPTDLRALDIIIASLTVRGRYAKAEVLANERAKVAAGQIEGESRSRSMPRDLVKGALISSDDEDDSQSLSLDLLAEDASSRPNGSSMGGSDGLADDEFSRIAELSLLEDGLQQPINKTLPTHPGDGLRVDGNQNAFYPPSFPELNEKGREPDYRPIESNLDEGDLKPKFPSNIVGQSLSGAPNDRVLPFKGERPPLSPSEIEGPTLALFGDPFSPSNQYEINSRGPTPIAASLPLPGPMPPAAFNAVLTPEAQTFDHYWRQGLYREARQLLKLTRPLASRETWWQERKVLVDKLHLEKQRLERDHARVLPPQLAHKPIDLPEAPAVMPPNWGSFVEALATMDELDLGSIRGFSRAFAPWSQLASGGELFPDDLLTKLIHAVTAVASKLDVEAYKAFHLQVFRLVWGEEVDPVSAPQKTKYVVDLRLSHLEPFFWGIYLDDLLNTQQARKVLHEVRFILKEKPLLAWARAGYSRLERAWSACGLVGFSWREEEGLAALCKILEHRRPPTLRAMLLEGGAKARTS